MFNLYEFEKRVKYEDDTKLKTFIADKRAKSMRGINKV
jgi:hypothetical protein